MAAPEQSRADSPTRVTRRRTADEAPPQPADAPLADQQAAIGNRELQQRLARGGLAVQTKLEVSGPSDAHEREADRVADTIMTMPDPAVQRQPQAEQVEEVEEEAAPKLARQADTEEIEEFEQEAAPKLDRQADAEELEEPEEEALAPKAAATPAMTSATESAIARSRGGGHPLDSATRGFFEPRFGRDLSGVKAHTDPGAARLASDMGAQAFTVGRDVYFAAGRYQPNTEQGRSLLAHELTHTVQQQPGRKLDDATAEPAPATSSAVPAVQRAADDGDDTDGNGSTDQATGPTGPPTAPVAGRINVEEGNPPKMTITYPVLRLPVFKAAPHRKQLYDEAIRSDKGLRHQRDYNRGSPRQRQVWTRGLPLAEMKQKVQDKLELDGTFDPDDTSRVYVLKHEESRYRLIGTVSTMAQEARDPVWDRDGHPDPKDVDHIVELQVSGWGPGAAGAYTWDKANEVDNMELLDNEANARSGSTIDKELDRLAKVTADEYWQPPSEEAEQEEETEETEEAETVDSGFWLAPTKPKVDDVRNRYDFVFESVAGGLEQHGDPDNYWTFSEVQAGTPLEKFEAEASAEAGDKWRVYPFNTGGIPQEVDPTGDSEAQLPPEKKEGWFKPFTVDGYRLNENAANADGGEEIGWVRLKAKKRSSGGYYAIFKGGQDAEVPILRFGGIPNAGYLKHRSLLSAWRGLSAKSLSPVEIESFTLVPDEGFHARGTLLPDVPIMARLGIDLVIEGDAVYLARSFDVGDFDLPGPVEITHSTIEVTAGSNGLGATGDLGLAIEGVGEGLITARIDTASGLALAGAFTFDPELFDPPAEIELGYADGEFSGSGRLTIGEDRVRGIKTATITASYDEGSLQATGDAELDVPGLERGTMSLSYSEEEGFALGGSFDVSPDVPGISSGSVSAEVRRDPEEGYSVSASGTAVPDIPGVSTQIDVAYDDGIFIAEGTAGYERGLLSGSLTVGATNESLDDEGNPTGEAGDTLRAFGGGDLTLQLAPWLEATAGVRLTPEGEVEVTGQIGLPEALEVFPERRYDRNILSIDVDIPIVGITVPVIRRNIGIFASIGGGLDLTAGFGPGELRELGLEISYNPEREEETEVTGGAEFVVPADAGLRLFVRGALGAGIPVVDARLGLEIGGGLGIEGAVRAAVEVAWTPTDGIELDAEAEIFAEPKLKLDITGFASVEADVGFASYDLYSERWRLAGFEYGSGLRLGATFPIHYVEGEPFDVSMDDIEFQVPDVNPRALLSGIVDEFT